MSLKVLPDLTVNVTALDAGLAPVTGEAITTPQLIFKCFLDDIGSADSLQGNATMALMNVKNRQSSGGMRDLAQACIDAATVVEEVMDYRT